MKKLSEAKRKVEAETEVARDAGGAYFRAHPKAVEAVVLLAAERRYGGADDLHRYWGFYEGFRMARAVHDEYLREQREFESKP